jgi:uncharacterized protein (DUF608 family)
MKYTRDELYALGPQRVYKNENLNEISFPLGGIGTGSIGLTGRGSLKDFEIFNKPNYGSWYTRTFPCIRTQIDGEDPVCRVLEGPIARPYTPADGGKFHANGEGFPHMDATEFRGEYPFAWIKFISQKLPVTVELEAYNPFIPSDSEASSIPAAILHYRVKNPTEKKIRVAIMWSLLNLVDAVPENVTLVCPDAAAIHKGPFMNTFLRDEKIAGIMYTNCGFSEADPQYGTVMLSSPNKNATGTSYWAQKPWFMAHADLWNYFKSNGELNQRAPNRIQSDTPDAGALAISELLAPGEEKAFMFYITWHFPNFEKYWSNSQGKKPVWKNYYATRFEDACDVANFLANNEERYHYPYSKRFHDALFGSTLPPYVIDAIASNMAILKTATSVRLPDGTFYGWEGTNSMSGCCEGTCAHVWNYQQTLPFLFPDLQRSIHNATYKYDFIIDDVGALEFRTQLPLGSGHGFPRPAGDGQFGLLINAFREWKISGDDGWLTEHWPAIKKAIEFAFEDWDEERTGVLKNFQHNTYDIDWEGMNIHTTSYYLGALLAGEMMARHLGDNKTAEEFHRIFKQGESYVDSHLFDGEYYIQLYDPKKAPNWQLGPGCLTDQLVGLLLARIAGLPNFLNHEHVRTTLKSIFKYNYRPSMRDHENYARLYAVNDEAAILICSWPKGGRPEVPFPYADEVMNGFEYQFAIHCILEDMLDEGLTVVKSIRDRYDGYGRNPWDEFECGHHYARSMAAYGLLPALSGFKYDKGIGKLGFDPKINRDNFQVFWALDKVWGTYSQKKEGIALYIDFGLIKLNELDLPYVYGKMFSVLKNKTPVSFSQNNKGTISFSNTVVLCENDTLFINLL